MKEYFKNVKDKSWIALFEKYCPLYEINNKLRICHFLAQVFHETNYLKILKENLFYSKEGLLKTFKKYFNEETAILYEKKPEKIANRVYANRMANGNEQSGDGYKYRGRGAFQLTGRQNYEFYGKILDIDLINNPNLVSQDKEIVVLTACLFWKENKLNILADRHNLKEIRQKINGGNNGLEDCQGKFNKLYKI